MNPQAHKKHELNPKLLGINVGIQVTSFAVKGQHR